MEKKEHAVEQHISPKGRDQMKVSFLCTHDRNKKAKSQFFCERGNFHCSADKAMKRRHGRRRAL
jgi:hypothetical protein